MIFGRGKDKKESARAQPRPRVKPLWRQAWVIPVLGAVIMGSAAGGGWWMIASGTAEKMGDKARWAAISATAGLGFKVNEVMVSGRHQTARDTLVSTLNLSRGAPILAFDIHAAKARLENLAWVRSATVERMLPDTILISIYEREPLALWQQNGTLHLIDAEGEVILSEGLEDYADLLVVVGEGAQARAADLIQLLGGEPELMNQVRAATWVGNRRWNVHLKGGVDVRLPEEEAAMAWAKLGEYQRNHKVLDKNVTVLDLRIPDRLIVKTGPKDERAPGEET